MTPTRFPTQSLLNRLAALSMILAAASVVWLVAAVHPRFRPDVANTGPRVSRREPPRHTVPKEPISLVGAALRGTLDAKVGAIVFSDFQCPFCAKFAKEAFPEIARSHIDSGRAFVAFRHLPLEGIHPLARSAAEAAECARRQGLFWDVHDRLFAAPSPLTPSSIAELSTIGALDKEQFLRCQAEDASDAIARDVAEARAIGISGTPTFLFGSLNSQGELVISRLEAGALPPERFATILDEVIESSKGSIGSK